MGTGRWKKRAQKVKRCWGFGADTQTCSPGPFRYEITTLPLLQGKVFLEAFTLCAGSEAIVGQKPKLLVGFPRRRTHPKTRESLCVQMLSCGKWDQTAPKGVTKYPKSWCLVGKGLVCATQQGTMSWEERRRLGADVAGGLIKTSATSGGAMSRHCQHVPSSAKGPWVCHIRLRKQNRCASFPGLCVLPEGCFCCVVPAVSCIKVCHGQPAQQAEHLLHEDSGDSCIPKCPTAPCDKFEAVLCGFGDVPVQYPYFWPDVPGRSLL